MTSSLSARVGFVPVLVVSDARTMLLGAVAPSSMLRFSGPEAYRVPSVWVAVCGSWLISPAYGSMRSLFGLKRLPCPSTSETKPAPGFVVLFQLALYVQFGPHAR